MGRCAEYVAVADAVGGSKLAFVSQRRTDCFWHFNASSFYPALRLNVDSQTPKYLKWLAALATPTAI